ncbi:MAG TPA: methyltransferase domain-containing protein [Candidatus Binatia bacterium]
MEPHIGRADNVLDLGSGTGRFAVLIAEWFGATVIGVEPAGAMREVAATSGRHAKVLYVAGLAEQLPLREMSLARPCFRTSITTSRIGDLVLWNSTGFCDRTAGC